MIYTLAMYKAKLPYLFFRKIGFQVFLGIFIFSLLSFSLKTMALSLIVNNSVTETPSSTQAIRNIFTLQRKYWDNGSKIKIFVFVDDNLLHQQFCKQITHIFPHQYRRIWDRLRFSGTGVAPTTVKTIEEMLERITKTKNAIGYIDDSQIGESQADESDGLTQLRVIKLEGFVDGVQ